ncbi:unnamed protein product [Soboliphyme baturini]|uniref:RRM domain-containing protein n=1 Tax=Soboliphyme baturini TaxID=241478 RepID=A0A183J7E5_9BILA|nr:unnamed protein product [Soboliphyme baturini]
MLILSDRIESEALRLLLLARAAEDYVVSAFNGNAMSPQTPGKHMDSDAKKAKLDQCAAAATTATATATATVVAATENVSPVNLVDVGEERSCVVHLRNLPADMTDVELIQMCIPFGKVTNFLLLKAKNQAFLQYEEESSAAALVSTSRTSTITLRGRTVFCQFSNHHELKTDNKNAFNVVASVSNS